MSLKIFMTELEKSLEHRYKVCQDFAATPSSILLAVLNAVVEAKMKIDDDPPIDMILFCPACGEQHIDAPNPRESWTNPPHRTHQCEKCGQEWRPADVATNGVGALKTAEIPVRPLRHDLRRDVVFCGEAQYRRSRPDGRRSGLTDER